MWSSSIRALTESPGVDSMRFRPLRLLPALFFVAVCASQKLDAQTTTSGALAGIVTDQSGAVVPDSNVEIKDNAKGTTQSSKTDHEGVYQFFFLAPGRYTLTVRHVGFREVKRTVNVLVGPAISVNVALAIAEAHSEMKVTDEAPLLHAENGDVSDTIGQTQISELPNPGNDLTYIAQIAPGAVMNTDLTGFGSFSLLGMPSTSNRYTVDGLDITFGTGLPMTGALGLFLGQNQLQEATVVSTGYEGQFGGAAGGNINYVTKSGSNQFHGNVQYYWDGNPLSANNWFLNSFGVAHPTTNANQWAGSFGGPIRKDKLFFFFDTEGLATIVRSLLIVDIPSREFEAATLANIESKFGQDSASASFYRKIFDLYDAARGASSSEPGSFFSSDILGCNGFKGPNGLGDAVPCLRHFKTLVGRPSQDTVTSGRLDWNIRTADRVFFHVQYNRGTDASAEDPINSAFNSDHHISAWRAQILETHTFGSSGASQFLAAFSHSNERFGVKDLSRTLLAFPALLAPPFSGLGNPFVYQERLNRYQLSEDVIKTQGNKKFGFGTSFERTPWTETDHFVDEFGILAVQTLGALYEGGVGPNPDDFTVLSRAFLVEPSRHFGSNYLAVYGQADWHTRSNLTLSLAVRAEHYSNPVCRSACFTRMAGPFASVSHDPEQPYNRAVLVGQEHALIGTDPILWSPRFNFAWAPFGPSRSTVLRGGFGIFYDPLSPVLAFVAARNAPLVNSYTISGDNLAPGEKTNLFTDAKDSNDAFVSGFYTGKTLAEIQTTVPNFSPPAMILPQKLTHSPQFQRWSLELQQGIGSRTSLSIGYFGHHGIHQLFVNDSANAYCDPTSASNPCFGFRSSLPVSVPDPRFSRVSEIKSTGISNYNALVISFNHRFGGSSQGLLRANYTYGHTLDEISNGVFRPFRDLPQSPQDPNDLRGGYGSADYDVRHSFNAGYVWEPPVKKLLRGHGPASLVQEWQISGTFFAHTGFPYTAFDSFESSKLATNNYFGAIYAVPVAPLGPGQPCGARAAFGFTGVPRPCQPPQYLDDGTPNPNANFVQRGCETGFNRGTLPSASDPCGGPEVAFAQGRNRFRGPGYFNTDLAIMKYTRIPGWEDAVLGLGLQAFNVLNHPNFATPGNNIDDGLFFGRILFMAGSPTGVLGPNNPISPIGMVRSIQLKAELKF
jgi:Carboxypeptidase regulatory-like domain